MTPRLRSVSLEREQLVQRAALLERAGALQVFKLQVQGQAGQLGEVMRELAGRDVNGVADARARRLNAGEGDGFQRKFSLNAKKRETGWKIEKPPAAFAGGGLGDARRLNPVRQASLPAREIGAANSNGWNFDNNTRRLKAARDGGGRMHDDDLSRAERQGAVKRTTRGLRRMRRAWQRIRVRATAGREARDRPLRAPGPRCSYERGRRRGGRRPEPG